MSAQRGDHRQDDIERAGGCVQIHHITGEQLGERDAVLRVVVGIVERGGKCGAQIYRAVLHSGSEEPGGDPEVKIVERADPSGEIELGDTDEERLRRRQSRSEVDAHREVEVQQRGEIELRRGIHADAKRSGVESKIDRQRGRLCAVEVEVQEQLLIGRRRCDGGERAA